jgi:hypothetical protein
MVLLRKYGKEQKKIFESVLMVLLRKYGKEINQMIEND